MDALRVSLNMAMLGYASLSDLKTREVSDLTWVVFGALGLVLDAYEVTIGKLNLPNLVVPILFSAALSFALGYLGLFGGADFKAFVALAVLQPYPSQLVKPVFGIVSVIYPLTVFSNSALAGASFALVILIRNVITSRTAPSLFEGHESEAIWRRFIVLISGIKVRLDSVRGPPFQYPLEVPLDEKGADRRLIIMPDIEDDKEALEIFKRLERAGVEEVWVSHTLPFLVFIAFGYISSIALGDVALWLLGRMMFS